MNLIIYLLTAIGFFAIIIFIIVDFFGGFLVSIGYFIYGLEALLGRKIDHKPGKAPVTDLDFGYMWLIAGIFFIYASVSIFRTAIKFESYPQFLRCVGCGKFYNFSDVKENPICKACGEKLVKEDEYENAINQKEAERLRAERIANGITKLKN
ncbi:hypothetical protein [Campylobacter sp. MG1]|uniref:hypothetical protein n=1 Tax=Campylobacter sp. MG1 TaxID=2976332 RepID=UPI00226CD5F1|nr:hypothetical protein [Campylobacter sp. MG1]